MCHFSWAAWRSSPKLKHSGLAAAIEGIRLMKPTSDVPKKSTDAKKLKSKRVANGIVVVMGILLYADLFAQPACGPETNTGGGVVDASVNDADNSIDAAADPSLVDAAVNPLVDAAPPADCFTLAAGTLYRGNYGCSLGDTTLTIASGGQLLAPFGYMNTAGQTFTPKAGAPNQATATNVTIYGQPGHTCTLTCTPGTPKPTLSVSCVQAPTDAGGNPQMCTENWTLPPDGGVQLDAGFAVDAQ